MKTGQSIMLTATFLVATGTVFHAGACELQATDQIASCLRDYMREWATGYSLQSSSQTEFADFAGRSASPEWMIKASAPSVESASASTSALGVQRTGTKDAKLSANRSANESVYR